jgi:hypothetical protein
MNKHASLPTHPAADPRGDPPLKAWRKRQWIDVPGAGRRTVKLTDVPGLWGIPQQSWHAWEQWPDSPSYRAPNGPNVEKLFKLTNGEVRPEDFYPVGEWERALSAGSGG